MRAILDARLAYARDNLFHGYVDGHEVHHEPRSITWALLAAVDYAPRGGLPIVGLAYQTGGRPGSSFWRNRADSRARVVTGELQHRVLSESPRPLAYELHRRIADEALGLGDRLLGATESSRESALGEAGGLPGLT